MYIHWWIYFAGLIKQINSITLHSSGYVVLGNAMIFLNDKYHVDLFCFPWIPLIYSLGISIVISGWTYTLDLCKNV